MCAVVSCCPSALRQTYNLIAIGAGTGGLISASGSAGLYAKVSCGAFAVFRYHIVSQSLPCQHPANLSIQGCVVRRFPVSPLRPITSTVRKMPAQTRPHYLKHSNRYVYSSWHITIISRQRHLEGYRFVTVLLQRRTILGTYKSGTAITIPRPRLRAHRNATKTHEFDRYSPSLFPARNDSLMSQWQSSRVSSLQSQTC